MELEKLNFFSAAETLSEIWLRTVIDGHDVYRCASSATKSEIYCPNSRSCMGVEACATITVPTSDCEMLQHYMLHALHY